MNIDFIFDFASPNAYLAHGVIPAMETRTGAKFNYIPCLLGGIFKATNNLPPMVAFAEIPAKLAYQKLEMQRFIAKHELDKFAFNPHFPINTLQLIRGAIAAHSDGYLMDYINAMLPCMWEHGLKMDDADVLYAAFADAGFDADRLTQQMRDDTIKAQLIANTNAAVERGAFGVPTFYVGDEMFFGKETLIQIENLINKEEQK